MKNCLKQVQKLAYKNVDPSLLIKLYKFIRLVETETDSINSSEYQFSCLTFRIDPPKWFHKYNILTCLIKKKKKKSLYQIDELKIMN